MGKASHPVQADSWRLAYPAYGAGGPQRKLISTVSPHSSALPDSPPSIPHPQISVREPWDPALRVSGLPASCPRLWAKPKPRPRPPNGHLCLHGDVPRGQDRAQVRHPLDSPAGASRGWEPRLLPAQEGQDMRGAGATTSAQKGALGSLVLAAPRAPCLHRTTPPPATAPLGILKPRGGGLCGSGRSPPPLLRPQAEPLMLDDLPQISGHRGRMGTVDSALCLGLLFS